MRKKGLETVQINKSMPATDKFSWQKPLSARRKSYVDCNLQTMKEKGSLSPHS